MANSDYTTRGSGLITPSARLANTYGPGALILNIANYTSDVSTTPPAIGSAVMIGGEIMKLTAFSFEQIEVLRGCADTIPRNLVNGAKVWFLDADMRVGSDAREYAAAGTVGVKVLMRTSGTQMGVQNSPPNALTFNQRFIRPYPPAGVTIQGLPFYNTAVRQDDDAPDVTFTWVERNRVTQADQLLGHSEGGVTPEPGTTYEVRIYDQAGTLLRTVDGIESTAWTYTRLMAQSDFDPGVNFAFAMINSRRDGFASREAYRIDFRVALSAPTGFGYDFGNNFGG